MQKFWLATFIRIYFVIIINIIYFYIRKMPKLFAKPQTTKIAGQQYARAATKATVKYRRLQTLIWKAFELSEKCGTSLSLIVKDKRQNKITEYHTDNDVKLENILP